MPFGSVPSEVTGGDDRPSVSRRAQLRQEALVVGAPVQLVIENQRAGGGPGGERSKLGGRGVRPRVIRLPRGRTGAEAIGRIDLVDEEVAAVAGGDDGIARAGVAGDDDDADADAGL